MTGIKNLNIKKPVPFFYVGCAGWAIPSRIAESFPGAGSHLNRYAQVFNAVEINSSFYRTHLPKTYRRWADAVPETFRFSVKFPRTITHHAMLQACGDLLPGFLAGVDELGVRLGCLLLQLPPRLSWNAALLVPFLERLRRLHAGPIACEPRHASWFNADVERILANYRIARVGADPALSMRARVPAGDRHLAYLRLHGSPRVYRDSYDDVSILNLATRLQRLDRETRQRWCVFDNTAEGHAIANALDLVGRLRSRQSLELESTP